MDPYIEIGIAGLIVSASSAAATLYVARRGGTFRKSSPALSIGGAALSNGRELTVVYGVPIHRGMARSSLMFLLSNPGKDTIDDIVLTLVVPSFMSGFWDDERGRSNIKLELVQQIRAGV